MAVARTIAMEVAVAPVVAVAVAVTTVAVATAAVAADNAFPHSGLLGRMRRRSK